MKETRGPALKRRKTKIYFFGNFGTHNFGNEATLQAIHFHLRRLMPEAEFGCICTFPENASATHGIPALPISAPVITIWAPKTPAARLLRKLIVGIPNEVYRWWDAFRKLKGTDAVIVPGTGLLQDVHDLFQWGPYGLLRWSAVAKLRGCKLLFVSVGAGPLYRSLGRGFAKSALAIADFRSYRDVSSLHYLKSIGFAASNDRVYPDLAFSLPQPVITRELTTRRRPVVGLGVMHHDGMYGDIRHDDETYQRYREALVVLVKWLLDRGYDVRLLIGELRDPVSEFKHLLVERLPKDDCTRITDGSQVTSANELLSQFADTAFVIATRFHNVLFALLNGKPTVSISFHLKCSSLMSAMGLSEYSIQIDRLNTGHLIERVLEMEKNSDDLKTTIAAKVEEFRGALEEQYKIITDRVTLV